MEQEVERDRIAEAKKGSNEAFATLFQENYMFLYKYLIKLSLHPQITEDLIQDTMIKAYTHLPNFKGDSKFSTWLISIASRLYIDLQRRERRRKKLFEKVRSEEVRKIKWQISLKDNWSDDMELFANLSPEYRVPILLKHYYGYKNIEIAKMLDLKEGTVKSRIHNGLKQMRKEWSE